MGEKITAKELQKRYETTRVRTLAEELDVSVVRLYRMLDECGVVRKSPGHVNKRISKEYEIQK